MPSPVATSTSQALVVAKGGLPEILSVLVYLELVSSRAVNNLQDIKVTSPIVLPSALICFPRRVSGNIALGHSLELIHLGKAEIV